MITSIKGQKIEYDIKPYRYHRLENQDKSVKIKTATGAIAGTLIPMMYFAKKQNVNPFKIKYKLKEMITVSAGSIIGGLIGGVIADKKEYRKQKVNESVFQFLNASIPPLLTFGLYKISKNLTYRIAGTAIGLIGGMHIAAKLANKINDPLDKVPDRKLNIKDSIANIDDALGVLVLAKVPLIEKLHLDKLLPAIYSWCGYRGGISN